MIFKKIHRKWNSGVPVFFLKREMKAATHQPGALEDLELAPAVSQESFKQSTYCKAYGHMGRREANGRFFTEMLQTSVSTGVWWGVTNKGILPFSVIVKTAYASLYA